MILNNLKDFINYLSLIKEPTHWIVFVSLAGVILIWIRIIYLNKEIEEKERR